MQLEYNVTVVQSTQPTSEDTQDGCLGEVLVLLDYSQRRHCGTKSKLEERQW